MVDASPLRFLLVKVRATLCHSYTHQENDTLSDPSYVACHRHIRQIKTDLMRLGQAMYLSG